MLVFTCLLLELAYGRRMSTNPAMMLAADVSVRHPMNETSPGVAHPPDAGQNATVAVGPDGKPELWRVEPDGAGMAVNRSALNNTTHVDQLGKQFMNATPRSFSETAEVKGTSAEAKNTTEWGGCIECRSMNVWCKDGRHFVIDRWPEGDVKNAGKLFTKTRLLTGFFGPFAQLATKVFTDKKMSCRRMLMTEQKTKRVIAYHNFNGQPPPIDKNKGGKNARKEDGMPSPLWFENCAALSYCQPTARIPFMNAGLNKKYVTNPPDYIHKAANKCLRTACDGKGVRKLNYTSASRWKVAKNVADFWTGGSLGAALGVIFR